MEKNFKATTVLDLLFHAANTNPSKVYCKSADHEFTYKHFIAACCCASFFDLPSPMKNFVLDSLTATLKTG